MSSELSGRRVFITGAGRRLGREIALGLARRGADVAIHYYPDEAQAQQTLAEIRSLGRKTCGVYADFREPDIGRRLAQALNDSAFRPNVLINSASTFPEADLVYASRNLLNEGEDLWNDALAVNARAPYLLTQALAPVLLTEENPLVLNIVDESVTEPFLDRPTHTVSKRALLQVSKIVAQAFSGKLRSIALELPPVMPGDGMSEKEIHKKNWSGVAPVVAAIVRVIHDRNLKEAFYRLGELAS